MYTIISLLVLEGSMESQSDLEQHDLHYKHDLDPIPRSRTLLKDIIRRQEETENSARKKLLGNTTKTNGSKKKSVRVKLYPSYLKDKKRDHDRTNTSLPHLIFVAKEDEKIAQDRKKHIAPPTCDPQSDCARFKKLLEQWPSDKPKAVFYYLTKSDRLWFLKMSLESVDKYYNNKYKYPIIIFHEEELIPALPAIRRYTHSQVFFQKVEFGVPNFLTQPVVYDIPCTSKIGYRHMCRFHAKQVHKMPILQGLDWYWRLDDDSKLLTPVNYDVFLYMHNHNWLYGYAWIHWDANECTTGLWEATKKYIKENHISPTFFHEWPRPRLFYNNFEIAKFSIWTDPGYSKYIDYLDKLGGIYYHRWGDAPIKGLGLSLFVPMNQTHQFRDIGYEHASFRNV